MAANKTSAKNAKNEAGFSEDERAAMRERALELKAESLGKSKQDPEAEVLAKIAALPEPDRGMALRLHQLIMKNFPSLTPKTWYGMPAYAKDGKVICFFQSGSKFKTRYCTLGFSDAALLDEDNFWPTAFAVKAMTAVEEEKILSLLKKALG